MDEKYFILCLLLFDRTKNLKKEIDLFNDSMITEMHDMCVSFRVFNRKCVWGGGERGDVSARQGKGEERRVRVVEGRTIPEEIRQRNGGNVY